MVSQATTYYQPETEVVRVTWMAPQERLLFEFQQLREEGIDPSGIERKWRELAPEPGTSVARKLALQLLEECAALIGHLRPVERQHLDSLPPVELGAFDRRILRQQILGGWQGRMVGCLLGKPVEKASREGIRAILESIGEWPLRRYFTAIGVPESVTERYPWNRGSRLNSLRENIEGMPEDDDINYPMLNLHVLETHGPEFTTSDVASAWLRMMPALTVFTAERVAYYNLLGGIQPPETARFGNPYREWIGAQIRGSLWGWTSPGDVANAADLAWRDATLSHTGNGVYAEMLAAALVAAAFSARDIEEVVQRALDVVPDDSRLAEALGFSRRIAHSGSSWERILDALHERYGHYHWAHAINNSALVVAALIHSDGDFARSITSVVMGGWDTDSNGATVGSVVGTLGGASVIPDEWLEPIGGRVRTSLKGFDSVTVDSLADRTLALVPAKYVAVGAVRG